MKILIFANSSWNLYNFRIGLIRKLVLKKYEVSFISSNDKYSKLLTKENINFVKLDISPKGKNIFKELITIIKLYFIIRKLNPVYILAFTIKPNLYSLLISYFLNIKVINNITGLGNTFINKNLLTLLIKILYKILIRKSHFIFFQNKDDCFEFKKLKVLNKKNFSIIPGSGINLNYFNKIKKSDFNKNINFVYVGRTIKEKGIFEFCEATKIINKKYKNVSFSIIGFNKYNDIINIYKNIIYIYEDNLEKNIY